MGDLIKRQTGAIEQFDPSRYRLKQAALDYGIEEAKRIKDWPALEDAVDVKIEEQHKFVAWWDVSVRDAGQPTKELSVVADNSLRRKDAVTLTGMQPQRVTDLRNRLARDDQPAILNMIVNRASIYEWAF